MQADAPVFMLARIERARLANQEVLDPLDVVVRGTHLLIEEPLNRIASISCQVR